MNFKFAQALILQSEVYIIIEEYKDAEKNLNQASRIADEFNVPFYNITPISREAGNNPDLIASDGLHPSELMYKRWVDQFINQVAEKLPQ